MTGKYDRHIASASFEGVPTPEECTERENALKAEINGEYNTESLQLTGRTAPDGDDNVAVRRRIMNRQLEARNGNLYARFGEAVNSLVEQAAISLKSAFESLLETQANIAAAGACKPEQIAAEFAALKASITDQIGASYPGGEEALDKYDDNLPDGVMSLDDLRKHIESCEQSAQDTNAASVTEAVAQMRKAIHDEMVEQLTVAIDGIRETLAVDLPWLDDATQADMVSDANEELDSVLKFATESTRAQEL